MRRAFLVLGSGALLALAAWASSEKEATGEVVDLAGYLMLGSRGEACRDQAQASLSKGGTAALLTEDGKILLLLADPQKSERLDFSAHAGRSVSVRGTAYSKGGVTGLVASSVEPVKP